MIIDKLVDFVEKKALSRSIKDIRVGLSYTAVVLDDGSCGIAFNFRNEMSSCCRPVNEAGSLIGMSCKDLLPWAKDVQLIKAAIGIAVMNALLHGTYDDFIVGNAIDNMKIGSEDTIGMIGNFKPIKDSLEKTVRKLYVFERNGLDDTCVYPDYAMDIYMPECSAAIITGTSFINKTIDHILEKCKNAREIAVIGPTAPLCPSVLKEYGVTLIGGVKPTSAGKIMTVVGQGGSPLRMKGCLEQICIKI